MNKKKNKEELQSRRQLLRMKNLYRVILCLLIALPAFGQSKDTEPVLVDRDRQPVDTASLSRGSEACMVLFVHSFVGSDCIDGTGCATSRMMKALAADSLNLRSSLGLKLYIVYPRFSRKDIDILNRYPQKNTDVLFETGWYIYQKSLGGTTLTPYIAVFDGKGNRFTTGPIAYSELCEAVKEWFNNRNACN